MVGSGAGGVKALDAGDLTSKGRATRERIVAAAADLMFEQGVAGTSLQDVQQASRVSGSQLYHYFGDKASLVCAVIAWQGKTVLGRQRPWLSRLDSLQGIRAWRDYRPKPVPPACIASRMPTARW
jgi:AcrR family transcriptional regulator